MSVTGIIAEFNPLHKGHQYLISKAKEKGPVICVISGNFVQRGDTAIAEKSVRAEAALSCGADLVLELPVLWSMSTAQNFALGGVSALGYAGCDSIMFGSECGDISSLESAADTLSHPEFSEHLSHHLQKGITFAKARQNAAEELGAPYGVFSGANNNLAIEYILAAKSLNLDISFETVKRLGAGHDSLEEAEFVSATLLRNKLLEGDKEFALKYMPPKSAELFKHETLSDITRLERVILAVLRTKSKAEFSALPDISEGVENKLYNAVCTAATLDQLYETVKVKRYTMARIRRLVLSAFIGADNSFFLKPLPYIRVLGFNKAGEKLLRTAGKSSTVPIITRATDFERLDSLSKKVFETECRATDIYALSLEVPFPKGLEYTRKLLKTGE